MTGMGALHDRLHGELCHTTHPERFLAIMSAGCIEAEPDIPDSDRWGGSTPDKFGFVRLLGGVSLFDFDQFDPVQYQKDCPSSSWEYFVPHRTDWGASVWITIDRAAVSEALIPGLELTEKWKNGYLRHRVMPRIEAAHIGDVPVSAFRSAFLTWSDGRIVRDIELSNFDNAGFDRMLAEWRAERQ